LGDGGGLQDIAVVAGSLLTAAIRMTDGTVPGRLHWIAMVSAAILSSARMWSRIAQPTTLA
jgi:hypothetical protein